MSGTAAEDLAGSAGFDVTTVVVDQADVHARQGAAIGVLALGGRRVAPAAGDRRVLGGAVGPEDVDAELLRPVRHGGGHRRSAHARPADQRMVRRGAVGVVEERRKEERHAAARGEPVLEHCLQHGARVPFVDQMDGQPAGEGGEQ